MESAANKCYMVIGLCYVGAIMNDMPNPDPNQFKQSDSKKTPKLDSHLNPPDDSPSAAGLPSKTPPSGNAPAKPKGRIAANSALLKIGKKSADFSGSELTPMVEKKPVPPPEDIDDDDESSQTSQEYRRQAHIELLAEEIELAERAKKAEEDRRRKAEAPQRPLYAFKSKGQTVTVPTGDGTGMGTVPNSESTFEENPEAASAFVAPPAPPIRKSRIGLVIAVAALILFCLMGGAAWLVYTRFYPQFENYKKTLLARAPNNPPPEKKAPEEIKDPLTHDGESTPPKIPVDDTAKKTEEVKRTPNDQVPQQDDTRPKVPKEEATKKADDDKPALQVDEQQKALKADAERRVAEERRLREENERLIEIANREKEELRKKDEAAQRIAREKLKKEQEEEAAKAETPASAKPAANSATADVVKLDSVKTDEPKTAIAKNDDPKTPPAKSEVEKPPVTPPIPVETPIADVKPIPPAPPAPPAPAGTSEKLELPPGAIRLYIKASDPDGGKLAFQWHQLKGAATEIADPAAAQLRDEKWISQTYFIPPLPGNYEFEVTIKNDVGSESKKLFQIEVLPPTPLR